MLRRSTIQLLRFHFSLFLLPVYLFAISQLDKIDWPDAVIVFFILHVLVYPSSNGYNSYMDRDETPIGGLSKPLQPTKQLFYVTIIMDAVAVGLSLIISIYFVAGVLLYILASRAYSYRGIRLKKYPVTGYLIVIIFQGALTFLLSYHGSSVDKTLAIPFWPAVASSLLIGGYYPLTQIYQHEEDLKDGVVTISYKLGKKGTFVFCGIVFALATAAMFFTFDERGQLQLFFIFAVCMFPMIFFFMQWMVRTWKDQTKADFKNSLRMNLLASGCTTICFLILIIMKGFE
ncbi:MAG TPA: UbiA family prenyltransferase [Chitinophagaceae bacterium]|nr:UbiA family prenyltransferase [Chitinophagaceae bacterium]